MMDEKDSLLIRRKVDWLCYNVPIQIESVYTDMTLQQLNEPLLLTFPVTDKQINFEDSFTFDKKAAMPINTVSTLHDVFQCMSIDRTIYEDPVMYGEDFYICSTNSSGPIVYLTSMTSHLNNYKEDRKIPVAFTSDPNKLSTFRIIDPNPDKMYDLEGTPVQTYVPTSLVHSDSDMLLAIDLNDVVRTPDCVDFGAYFYSYRDSLKQISSANYWRFITPMNKNDTGDNDGSAPK